MTQKMIQTSVAAFFLVACASSVTPPLAEAPDAAVVPLAVRPGDPCSGPDLLLGNTEESVVRHLGRPSERDVQRLPNRHNPSVMDERITLRFDGAVVVLHTVPKYRASFLARVEISDSRFDIFPGLRVGMPRENAASALNVSAVKGTVTKECPRELPPTIEATFDSEKLTTLVWTDEPD